MRGKRIFGLGVIGFLVWSVCAHGQEVPQDWFSKVQKDIASSEYNVTWQECRIGNSECRMENEGREEALDNSEFPILNSQFSCYQAPNRAQNLRTHFTENGPRVVRRTETEPSWVWGFQLLSFGRRGNMQAAAEPSLVGEKNRLDYCRATLIERYENQERNVSFLGAEGEAILLYLDLEGVAVSTGSACATGSLDPSHVLLATGLGAELAHGSVRFSLGRFNTQAEVDYVLEKLPPIIDKIRAMSTVYTRHGGAA